MASIAPPSTFADRRAQRAKLAGSLTGDLGIIALNLHHALKRSDIVVWTDAAAEVYFDAADRCPNLEADHLVGTYGLGANIADIEADLGVVRHERLSNWMILSGDDA
ncbi:MAG: hypothetical protein ACTHK2_18875 [Dokdonella sp.]|uniref:hypothetical protein n=1 Tax=Dokdonella sp. TaxID=2291710 RepID=UPI003F80128A